MLAELEMEAEALDTIDPGIVAEYREAQEVEDFVNLVVVILSFCLRLCEKWRGTSFKESNSKERNNC